MSSLLRCQAINSIACTCIIIFEDTIESLIDTILHKRGMRVSSFRLSMGASQSPSGSMGDNSSNAMPAEMQINCFEYLSAALIEHKNACAIRHQ